MNRQAEIILKGFILSSNQIIAGNQTHLVFQGRLIDGRRFHWTITRPGIVFFINHDEPWTPPGAVRKDVKLCNMHGKSVDAIYFQNTQELNRARKECDARSISIVSVDEVKRLTGLDFNSLLDDAVEDDIEDDVERMW